MQDHLHPILDKHSLAFSIHALAHKHAPPWSGKLVWIHVMQQEFQRNEVCRVSRMEKRPAFIDFSIVQFDAPAGASLIVIDWHTRHTHTDPNGSTPQASSHLMSHTHSLRWGLLMRRDVITRHRWHHILCSQFINTYMLTTGETFPWETTTIFCIIWCARCRELGR